MRPYQIIKVLKDVIEISDHLVYRGTFCIDRKNPGALAGPHEVDSEALRLAFWGFRSKLIINECVRPFLL